MSKKADDQLVTVGMLRTTLNEVLAEAFEASEKRMTYSMGIMMDNKIKASEARTRQ